MVFAADKISKARELRLDPAPAAGSHHLPEAPPSRQQRLTHFHHCLELLEDTLSGSPLIEQLRMELESLPGAAGRQPALAGAA